jgi:hypothetical protein
LETAQSNLRFRISGFEMQDSSDFEFFVSNRMRQVVIALS